MHALSEPVSFQIHQNTKYNKLYYSSLADISGSVLCENSASADPTRWPECAFSDRSDISEIYFLTKCKFLSVIFQNALQSYNLFSRNARSCYLVRLSSIRLWLALYMTHFFDYSILQMAMQLNWNLAALIQAWLIESRDTYYITASHSGTYALTFEDSRWNHWVEECMS